MKIRLKFYIFFFLVGLVYFFLYINRPAMLPLEAYKAADILRVCAANIYYQNVHSLPVTESLLGTGADIFIITEWQGDNLDLEVFSKKGYRLVLNNPKPGVGGLSVIAKERVEVRAEVVESPVMGPCRMPIASARVQFDSTALSLLGIHAPPPLSGCEGTTDPTIKALAGMVDKGRLKTAVGAGEKGDAVVLAGDFNAFSFNREIAGLLASGLVDSYTVAGHGYGPTWAPFAWMPSLIRIDYIFVPNGLGVDGAYTINIPGSDHRGVVSDIRLVSDDS